MKKTLGIDIGGTNVKTGILQSAGTRINFSKTGEVKFTRDPNLLFKNISNLLRKKLLLSGISAAGIAVAGDTDHINGRVRFSPNFGWKDVPLKKIARQQLNIPDISVENDANAAAYGAYVFECNKKYPDMVCLTLGTGVGGGIITDGKLYRGATGSAGEFGHINYKEDGLRCSCGAKGCFERYLGRDAITERAINIIKNSNRQALRQYQKELSPKFISEKAALGEKWAIETWRETGRILGILISDIVNILNPSAIVLTGGISAAHRFFIKETLKEIRSRTFTYPRKALKIFVARKPDLLGAAGAAALASELLTETNNDNAAHL